MSTAAELQELLADGDEINIVCHDNPDPDCLASALALGRIAAAAGIDERHILYSGAISHQQNRAFVNLLDIDIQPFDPAAVTDRPPDSLLAFVDHSIPGENNQVPEGTPIDIVIDHHPAEEVEARFVDRREEVGAAATILTEYVQALGIEVDSRLATALMVAIRSDTLDFLRGATRAEYEAAGFLQEDVDGDMVRQISSPSVTGATLDAISTAIDNRMTTGAILISHVGRTSERDSLPQAVDYLARLEGVQTAIVFGIVEDTIHVSARSPDPRVHVGNLLRDAFEDVGSGGGHHDVAGGQIPLGIFADYTTDDEQLLDIVERVITDRLSKGLNISEDEES
ncbi:DHH family phosphoesterase [Halapricum hydrolyticum]|uniref:Bifunctional oligoribonuclease/PAP phosphatase NrnA n=1 Tax=Halapricum hydrolyticum TaxID=2979991 RepID=A0AAE3IBZ5_9EURY|nr:bifunctional oligoribonuclease/PAP phosphatase NrnA [Halapricum hydrolyticum]MCU4718031.1 bifunctional oligoribonuclease/PAP phosphatase NrnA [Halapricum hydrolyticum]MCU4727196.1 bifunctional oligoribonuclease/PAP phosphatase NrnA [Halapricum hydrolyticum]